jgi:hypothetical protein
MSYAEVTLKSGAKIEFDCTEVTWTSKINLLGEVVSKHLEWVTPEGAIRRIMHIEIGEIAAVIFIDTGEEGVSNEVLEAEAAVLGAGVPEIEVERDALRDRVALLERQIAQHSCGPRGLADLS